MNLQKPIPPCKWCDHRVVEDPEKGTKDCHDRCDEYISFREKLDEYNDTINHIRGVLKTADERPWIRRHKMLQKRNGEGGETVDRMDIEYRGGKS